MDHTKVEQERVRTLLIDTVTLLCKNGLRYDKQLQVQGLLAITIDEADVFVVQLSDIVKSDVSPVEVIQSLSSQNMIESGEKTESMHTQKRHTIPSHSIQKPRIHRHPASSTLGSQTLAPSIATSHQSKQRGEGSLPGRSHVKQEHQSDDITLITSDDEQEEEPRHFLSDSTNSRDIADDEHYQDTESTMLEDVGAAAVDVKPALDSALSQNSQVLCSYTAHTQSSREKKASSRSFKLEPVDASSALGVTINERCFNEQQNHGVQAAICAETGFMGQIEGNEFSGGGGEEDEGDDEGMKWNSSVGDYDQEDDYFLDPNLDEGLLDDSESRNSSGGRNTIRGPDVSVCEYENCGKWFNHRRSLFRHQRIKHGALFGASGQMCFYCTVASCRRVFYVRRTLEKHQRDVHQMNV